MTRLAVFMSLQIIAPSSQTSKKAIFIDGGIHAREWIAPATVLYFIEQVSLFYFTKTNITKQQIVSQTESFILMQM